MFEFCKALFSVAFKRTSANFNITHQFDDRNMKIIKALISLIFRWFISMPKLGWFDIYISNNEWSDNFKSKLKFLKCWHLPNFRLHMFRKKSILLRVTIETKWSNLLCSKPKKISTIDTFSKRKITFVEIQDLNIRVVSKKPKHNFEFLDKTYSQKLSWGYIYS